MKRLIDKIQWTSKTEAKRRIMRTRFYYIVIMTCLLGSSCQPDDNSAFKVKPSALGIMNDILVVSDQDIWDGPIGDSLHYYFGGSYPITPQPEPIFDLRHFTPKELLNRPLRKELRTYLIVADLSATNSETSELVKNDLKESGISNQLNGKKSALTIGKDKWAHGQILIYLFADGLDNLAESIGKNFPSISTRIRQFDALQLKQSTYSRGSNQGLSDKVATVIGVDIDIPFDYQLAKEVKEEGLIWLRKDTKDAVQNLVFRRQKYSSEDQTGKEYMKVLRNEFGKTHVSSSQPNSYMIINDVDLPILEYIKDINGLYTKEYRGIWEMENDFMGGPFITWMIVNDDDLIYVDGFVWAPGKTKRRLLQQLEKIVSTTNKNPI